MVEQRRCQRQIFQYRQVVEQVKVLEHHSHLLTGKVDVDIALLEQFLDFVLVFLALVFTKKVVLLDFCDNKGIQFFFACIRAKCFQLFEQKSVGLGKTDYVEVQVGINRGKKLIFQPNFTVGGGFKQVHTAEQGTFTAARRPDDNDLFALLDFTANAFKNF